MSQLSWMITITDRKKAPDFVALYQQQNIHVRLTTVGAGTAVSETLNYLGLERTEKAVIFTAVTDSRWKAVKRQLEHTMNIDVPGTGIAFTVPVSSIGGKRALQFLTEDQDFQIGEETTLKDTKYELLIVIANQGYSGLIMDAARSENAGGGTVIHAKGTGMERAEQFLGVSLAAEKEMVLIVIKREDKNRIMRAIMNQAGTASKARSVILSLPVTSTAGLRLLEDEEPEAGIEE